MFACRRRCCGARGAARRFQTGLSDPLLLSLAATFLLSLVFWTFPGIDLAVTGLFYRTGDGFALSRDPMLKALRASSTWVMGTMVTGALGVLAHRAATGRLIGSRQARRATFLISGLAAGPGLLVNGVLKSLWGRPRPVHLEIWGGKAVHVPVWRMSDQCTGNCSFVSGEASSAAWMVAVAALLPPSVRRWALWPVVTYAVALSMNRLAFGGHFLSDILLSWSLTALVLGLLWRCLPEATTSMRGRGGPGLSRLARLEPLGPVAPISTSALRLTANEGGRASHPKDGQSRADQAPPLAGAMPPPGRSGRQGLRASHAAEPRLNDL